MSRILALLWSLIFTVVLSRSELSHLHWSRPRHQLIISWVSEVAGVSAGHSGAHSVVLLVSQTWSHHYPGTQCAGARGPGPCSPWSSCPQYGSCVPNTAREDNCHFLHHQSLDRNWSNRETSLILQTTPPQQWTNVTFHYLLIPAQCKVKHQRLLRWIHENCNGTLKQFIRIIGEKQSVHTIELGWEWKLGIGFQTNNAVDLCLVQQEKTFK